MNITSGGKSLHDWYTGRLCQGGYIGPCQSIRKKKEERCDIDSGPIFYLIKQFTYPAGQIGISGSK